MKLSLCVFVVVVADEGILDMDEVSPLVLV